MSASNSYQSVAFPQFEDPSDTAQTAFTQIGVLAPSYGLEHVTYMLEVPGYRHVLRRRIPFHRLERSGTFWNMTPVILPPSVPLVHTFNMLPVNARRFVTTFELELPRYLGPGRKWQHRIGHKLLESNRCRALLALSDIASEIAKRNLRRGGFDQAASKIRVFRGGVLPSTASEPKQYAGGKAALRLLFVGGDGFRKGIIPLIEATEILRSGGVEIELTIVSSLNPKTYALRQLSLPKDEIGEKIESARWIKFHAQIPNAEVRSMMRHHDLFVFPSLDESLGWVVIEAGMEGLPSITTNIFAFPELVDDGVSGQLIKIDLNRDQRWIGLFADNQAEVWEHTCNQIRDGLITVLTEVDQNRDLISIWGAAALEKMTRLYHPKQAAKTLKQIYDQALS